MKWCLVASWYWRATTSLHTYFDNVVNPFVELGDRLSELLLARGMRGHFELPLHLGSRQTQRLELPRALRVAVPLAA